MSVESTANTAPEVGDKMPDGTIYAGISPDTGKPMYATPADAPLVMVWKKAVEYASALDAHGHKDWRVPSKGEMSALFSNRYAMGGIDTTGSSCTGWYWLSGQVVDHACGLRYSDLYHTNHINVPAVSLRCVRG